MKWPGCEKKTFLAPGHPEDGAPQTAGVLSTEIVRGIGAPLQELAMVCSACSRTVPEGRTRCPGCGALLSQTAVTETSDPNSPRSPRRSPPLHFTPGTTFAGRYTIVEEAGHGGMGVVYKAIDRSLDQAVALKLIRPELARAPAYVERFKREVKLTRKITHPNICRVHDLGESQGRLFLSMEWIEGETLRRLLNQAGRLEADRAFEICRKISLALGAAHSKQVIHRDLKPENVMVDAEGSVFVMDFGIAAGGGGASGPSTEAVLGTPAYMSPEQRRGDPVDERSDLYSLGLVLLEMLTGQMPDPARSPGETLNPRARRQLSGLLTALVSEAPTDRCESAHRAAELLDEAHQRCSDLHLVSTRAPEPDRIRSRRRIWVGAAVLSVAAALAYVLAPFRRPEHPSPPRAAPSAGQPFYERGLDYLHEEVESLRGIDDAIQMFHRALGSDTDFAAAQAGLGMAYWLRYAQTRDSASKEMANQSVLAAFSLDPDLPEASCARGIGYYVEADYPAAKQDLARAVSRSPGLDIGWAYLGSTHRQLGEYQEGLAALQQAIRLKPYSLLSQIALGRFYEHFGEYDAAAGVYHKAIDIKPDSRWAWNNLGAAFLRFGKPQEALPSFQKALEIEESANARSNLGTAYFFLKEYEKAAEQYRRAAELEPDNAVFRGNLGDSLKMLGRTREEKEAYREASRLAQARVVARPTDPEARLQMGLFCARAGEEKCALAATARAYEMQPKNSATLFTNAIILSLLHRADEALDWLEKAVNLGLTRVEIENEPDLAPLHDDPRYQRILQLAS